MISNQGYQCQPDTGCQPGISGPPEIIIISIIIVIIIIAFIIIIIIISLFHACSQG